MKYILKLVLSMSAVVSFTAMQGSAAKRLVSQLSVTGSVKTKVPHVQRQLLIDKKEGVKVYGAAYPLLATQTVPIVEIHGAFPVQPYARGGRLNVFRHLLPQVIIASVHKNEKMYAESPESIEKRINSLWSDNFAKDYVVNLRRLFVDIKPNFNADLMVYVPHNADLDVQMQNCGITYTHDPKFLAYVNTDCHQLINKISSAGAREINFKKYTSGWTFPLGKHLDASSPTLSLKTSSVIELRLTDDVQ